MKAKFRVITSRKISQAVPCAINYFAKLLESPCQLRNYKHTKSQLAEFQRVPPLWQMNRKEYFKLSVSSEYESTFQSDWYPDWWLQQAEPSEEVLFPLIVMSMSFDLFLCVPGGAGICVTYGRHVSNRLRIAYSESSRQKLLIDICMGRIGGGGRRGVRVFWPLHPKIYSATPTKV